LRQCFNPRLPGGRRLCGDVDIARRVDVSIHAFREEGDPGGRGVVRRVGRFQSTPSGRKATAQQRQADVRKLVSIHAFREEGDGAPPGDCALAGRFNPRLPGGRRPQNSTSRPRPAGFNPRLPGGRRLPVFVVVLCQIRVSIHAFREEGDSHFATVRVKMEFQSTPSGRKATARSPCLRARSVFQSTPSGRKATRSEDRSIPTRSFQSTPSGRKATSHTQAVVPPSSVSIHAFREEGDLHGSIACLMPQSVSIHAFREEGDSYRRRNSGIRSRFNPRLPGGRRPDVPGLRDVSRSGFNPRLPGGRRQSARLYPSSHHAFQSTPSGRKATMAALDIASDADLFQSTPSGRKATTDYAASIA